MILPSKEQKSIILASRLSTLAQYLKTTNGEYPLISPEDTHLRIKDVQYHIGASSSQFSVEFIEPTGTSFYYTQNEEDDVFVLVMIAILSTAERKVDFIEDRNTGQLLFAS